MAKKTYTAFLNALGQRESSGDYSAVNTLGFLGKYQFGEYALEDCGFYTADNTPGVNDWQASHWTGKDGVHSEADFLSNHAAQEDAIRIYMGLQYSYIKKVHAYADQTIDGVKLSVSSLLAGAHLVGWSVEVKYLSSGEKGSVPVDAYGTPMSQYWTLFGGYKTPYTVNHNVAEKIVGSSGDDVLHGRGGADTLIGHAGDDRLHGGTGHDTLTGGAGADRFVFDAPKDAGDTITDFTAKGHSHDEIVLHHAAFGLEDGVSLKVVNSETDPTPHGKSAQFLYNSSTGQLYFDSDGTGHHAAILLATLTNHPSALQSSDFLVT